MAEKLSTRLQKMKAKNPKRFAEYMALKKRTGRTSRDAFRKTVDKKGKQAKEITEKIPTSQRQIAAGTAVASLVPVVGKLIKPASKVATEAVKKGTKFYKRSQAAKKAAALKKQKAAEAARKAAEKAKKAAKLRKQKREYKQQYGSSTTKKVVKKTPKKVVKKTPIAAKLKKQRQVLADKLKKQRQAQAAKLKKQKQAQAAKLKKEYKQQYGSVKPASKTVFPKGGSSVKPASKTVKPSKVVKKKPVEMSAAARKKAEKLTKGYKKQQPKNKYSSTTNAKIARDATKGKPKPKPIIAPKPKTKITTKPKPKPIIAPKPKPKPKPKKNQGPNVAARKKTVGTLGKIALGGGLLLGGKAIYDASEKKKQDQSKNNKRILAEQKRMQQGQKNLPVIAKPKPERKSKIKDFVDVNEIDYDTDKDEGNGTEERKSLGEAMFGGFKTGDFTPKDQTVKNPFTGKDMEIKYEYPDDPDDGMKHGGSIKKNMKKKKAKTKVKKRIALRGYGAALRGF